MASATGNSFTGKSFSTFDDFAIMAMKCCSRQLKPEQCLLYHYLCNETLLFPWKMPIHIPKLLYCFVGPEHFWLMALKYVVPLIVGFLVIFLFLFNLAFCCYCLV